MDTSVMPEGKPFSSSRFVKVFMHGEPFGRKINLSVHNSYDSLSFSLKRLGRNYSISPSQLNGLAINEEHGGLDDNDFILLYDNAEGDRFFLGEVPWELFIISVKKIYIVPAEKEDDNEDYLEEEEGHNGDGNAGAADGNGAVPDGDGAVADGDGDGDGAITEDGDATADEE